VSNDWTPRPIPPPQDTSRTILNERVAFWVAVGLSVLTIPWVFFDAVRLWHIASDLFRILFTIWLSGVLIQFWRNRSYRGGLTFLKAATLVKWPMGAYRTVRDFVKKRSSSEN
jgi:hypothetical protein